MLGFNKYIRINFEASHNAFTHWSSMDVISTNFEEIVSKLTMTIAHLPSFTLTHPALPAHRVRPPPLQVQQ